MKKLKTLQENEQLLRQVVENIHEVFWMSSIDGKKVIYVSPAYEKIMDRSCDSLYKSPSSWLESIYPEDKSRVIKAVENARDFKYDEEYRIVKSDGSIHWVRDRSFPIYDSLGKLYRVAGITEDTTKRKELENSLVKLNEILREKKMELEVANKDLESFSYSVSHDLKSPLRVVSGFTGILLERLAGALNDDSKKLLTMISEHVQKMDQLITDILAFSQSARKAMQKSKIDMQRLMKDVFEEMRGTVPERKIEFHLANIPSALGDNPLIRQVVVNLLSNAVKYSKEKKVAIIEIGFKEEADQNIYYVKDNGDGFDMKYADKLFVTFQRLHDASKFEGTGVGLAIVKRILERHGGKVWAESKAGEGATFYFTLPKG